MEIERKFTLKSLPDNLESYPSHHIEQVYLNYNPVIRARKQDNEYYLTYKGSGMMTREEYNLPLTAESYEHLLAKADGNIITKKRYEIPDGTGKTIELDLFEGVFSGLTLAEVEFESIEEANAYIPPSWFTKDVTMDAAYHNSNMSKKVVTKP